MGSTKSRNPENRTRIRNPKETSRFSNWIVQKLPGNNCQRKCYIFRFVTPHSMVAENCYAKNAVFAGIIFVIFIHFLF